MHACFTCAKIFSNQSNLNRHLREKHSVEKKNYERNLHSFKCNECNSSFKNNNDLRQHLDNTHGFKTNSMEILKFPSFEEFQIWLKQEEYDKTIEYFKASTYTSVKSGEKYKTTYFSCNRSGKIVEKKVKLKITKIHGSCKLDRFCTSQIIVQSNLSTGIVKAKYYYVHYGHAISIQHVRLPKLTKEKVVEKLVAGVTPSRILMDERKFIGSESKLVQRKDLLTQKDINNIKASYNIHVNDGIRHKDDATSVHLWIRECLQFPDTNPVIFYKAQGKILPDCNLNKEDFCLVIMTAGQQLVLESLSKNIICVDSTHGLNAYDFEMTTLLVVDEFGEGFPGCCMYTNRKDTYIFEIFFQEIRKKLGTISCKVFMSDIAPAFYNAWQKIMGPADFHLFCSWHVDRCWQKNLHKVANVEQRQLLYKYLKLLQYALSQENFEDQLKCFLNFLEDVTLTEFKKYFLEHYVSIKKQWAYAYRKECHINTNMHLENMHRNLKYLYFDGKKIKRMDKSVHMLIIFIHEKCVERLIKFNKGKTTKHMLKIHGCHRAAAIATNYQIFFASDTEAIIMNTDNNVKYHIIKNESVNNCCFIRCNFCNICIHRYKCTCMDFLIRSVICKHIHFFVLNETPLVHGNGCLTDIHQNSNEDVNVTSQKLMNSFQTEEYNTEAKKQQIKKHLSNIATNLEHKSVSLEKIGTVFQHVKIADQILNIDENFITSSFPTRQATVTEPSNKNISKQITFFSTKKKRLKNTSNFRKPNAEEKNVMQNSLHDHNYL